MKKSRGNQPTCPEKHQEIEENMDKIAALQSRNRELELEIRIARMTGKVVHIADHIAAKKLRKELAVPQRRTRSSWAAS